MRGESAYKGLLLLLFVPLGYIDHLTGPTIDISFGYFILIVLITVNLGLAGAVFSVLAALATVIAAKAQWIGAGLTPAGFAANTLMRTAAFAIVAGLVNAASQERHKAERLSVTDKLTGLLNRRRFDEALPDEALRAERYKHPLALVILDVDHFKRYNDRHGHPRGDGVLRQMGKVLVRTKRSTDMAFRYGGEEFCLLLPETGLGEAKELAERVRLAVEREDFLGEHTQPGARLTASFGVAALAPGEEPRALVQRADDALYRAKEHGRNRVEVSEERARSRDRTALRRS